ncbi:hypothetical protein Peur_011953 [Populus x canadensis]
MGDTFLDRPFTMNYQSMSEAAACSLGTEFDALLSVCPFSLFLFPENKDNYASSDDCFSKALPNLDPLSFRAALPLTLLG